MSTPNPKIILTQPRFVGWTPLVLAIGLISGVSWATIIFNIALTWIWVSSWLSGALVATTYKWGFFVFGTFAYFLLAASLLTSGLTTAKRLNITPGGRSLNLGFRVGFRYVGQ